MKPNNVTNRYHSVTTFLEFLEMSGNSAKVGKSQEKGPKSGNLCIQGNLIAAAPQNAGNQTVV